MSSNTPGVPASAVPTSATSAVPTSVSMSSRYRFMLGCFLLVTTLFMGYQFFLTFVRQEFLQTQGEMRSNRLETVAAHRGIIFDRFGEPLAISTPVFTLVVDPVIAAWSEQETRRIAELLDISSSELSQMLQSHKQAGRRYLRLARRLDPEQAGKFRQPQLTGLFLEREYRRFYPAGEAAAHLVGATNSDNLGIEGIEYAYDRALAAHDGARRVLRNEQGEVVKHLGYEQLPRFGDDLVLSVDIHLQHHAHSALARAIQDTRAKSGALVMLDARNGEILALVNQPSFNPNAPFSEHGARRNRAVTDSYEPGSTVKPFAALAALRSRIFRPDSVIDTSPGHIRVGRKLVEDPRDYGVLTLTGVIAKSSQVGISRVALSLHETAVFEVLEALGFGTPTLSGLPFEEPGELSRRGLSSDLTRATLAYGYGLTVTPMQLASAYLTLATGGLRIRPTVFKSPPERAVGERIFARREVGQVTRMLEQPITSEGTAWRARVPGYKVAGKTGTVRKVGPSGYDSSRHATWFAGMAPASDPRFVLVVLIDEPDIRDASGGSVCAPVFARVAALAVHHLGIAPEVRA